MLKLSKISKDYQAGTTVVHALREVDLEFRKSEFVSILGPSGCGKTTMMNIIGGLDRYTSGDLIIDGKSTKQFTDHDWDSYRNHSIGFVFQNYNLIPHQSVLSNVELALTLSGVSKAERRRRAKEVLHKVGLGDQMDKKPNQMSGGQMQRVAIARALVNDPDIVLADEPTGALDSATSIQIMDLLKEISENKLIIMVTHNPELAETYSSRIIRLLDGQVQSDSNPYTEPPVTERPEKKHKKPTMSIFTALSLSLNNLMTKKARTFLTSFAGSIGIIGIAMILAISSGIQNYIDKVEEDTLSGYPIEIEHTAMDVSSVVSSMMGKNAPEEEHEDGKIYSNDIMTDMMTTMMGGMTENNLTDFKKYIEKKENGFSDLVTDIQYSYNTTMNIYRADDGKGLYRVNPNQVMKAMGFEGNRPTNTFAGGNIGSSYSNQSVWQEMLDNDALLKSQYTVLKGKMPTAYNELVLIVDKNNEISDYTLYALGIKDKQELTDKIKKYIDGEELEKPKQTSYSYDELLGLRFKLLLNTDYFTQNADGTWADHTDDDLFVLSKLEDATELKIVGIIRPADDSTVSASSGTIGYRSELMTKLIGMVNDSAIVKEQNAKPETDVFTGLKFASDEKLTIKDVNDYLATLPADESAKYQAYIGQMKAQGKTDEQIVELFAANLQKNMSKVTLDDNMERMGVSDLTKPSAIRLYPKDFESKEKISDKITEYNKSVKESDAITYTDYIGMMLSSITTIINAISYVLIAFVAISLVVSSIMIGIITYISVLERTKEIGILRSIGASKKDISRVFNAETLIVGLAAGLIGIGLTLLLIIPTNIILQAVTETTAAAALPWKGAVILVLISMALTLIAGLIPSKVAAKKDPVIALRTE